MSFIPSQLPISVATVADLATSKSRTVNGGVVQVASHSAAGDNGGSVRVYRKTGRSALPSAVLEGVCIAGSGADDYHELVDKNFFNVRSFGAHPANTPSQNHAAFQKAIDAAKSLHFAEDVDGYDGPTVYIPNGIYEISESLIIDQSVGRVRINIHGQDMFGTTIRKANSFTGEAMFDVTNVNPNSSSTYAQFWHWSKMQLLGFAANGSKVDYLFRCGGLVDSHFQDIYFNGARYACLRIGEAYINKFDRCWVFNGGLVGQLQTSSNCNACVWIGCIFGSVEVGMYFQGGIQNNILGCTIEGCTRTGIYFDRSNAFVVQSYFEANAENGHVIRTIDNDTTPLRPLIACTANAGTDVITATAHGLVNRKPVSFTNTGGALPAPLAVDTDYYVFAVTANTFKLATTYLNAKNEVGIDITTAGTGTHYVSRNWRVTANIIVNGSAFSTTNGELSHRLSAAAPTNSGIIQGVLGTTDEAPKTLLAVLSGSNIQIQQQSVPTAPAKTKGSINSGSTTLTVNSSVGFLRYRYYRIAGAGPGGADYFGMANNVDSIDQITMRDNASTTVTDVDVEMIPDSVVQFHGAHGSANGITITGPKGYSRVEFEVPTTNLSYGMADIHTSDFSFATRTVLRLQPEFTKLLYAGAGDPPYLLDSKYADRSEWVFDCPPSGALSETYASYYDLMQTPELIGQQCVAEMAWICLDIEGDIANTNRHITKLWVISDIGAGTSSSDNVDALAVGTVKAEATTTATSKVVTVTKYADDFAVGRYVVIRSAGAANISPVAFTANAGNDFITAVAHGLANEDTVLFTGADLPAGLSQGVMYFVRSATDDTFQVSLEVAGDTVDITDAGSGVMTFATHDLFYSKIVSKAGSNLTLADAVPTTLTSAVAITSPGISYTRMTFQLPTDTSSNEVYIGVSRNGGSPGSRSVILDAQIKAVGNPIGVLELEPRIIQEVTALTRPYRAVADGVTDTRAILFAYATDMDALGRNVIIPEGIYYISSSITYDVMHEFRRGGIYRPAAGANVTMPNYIADDDQQIFDVKTTLGACFVTDREYVTVKHYGALGDGTTNDYIPIAYAYQASNGAQVRFPPGVYVTGTNLDITSDVHFEDGASIKPSSGRSVTVYKYTYDGDWPFDTSAGGSFIFANNADGNLGATHTFVCDEGGDNIKTGTLTADVALTLSASKPGWYSIILTQDGTGGWDVTSYVTTIVGTAPTIAAGIGAKTLLSLRYDGTNWFWM